MASPPGPVTVLLQAWAGGDREALDRLTPMVYGELKRLAEANMRRERQGHTWSPTDLVSEAFMRLAGGEHPPYQGRVQFFAVAARHMRRILVDYARQRGAGKRGGKDRPVTLDAEKIAEERPSEFLLLDEALLALAGVDDRKARAVELHYFGGMSHEEIATALSVHANTVARDLRLAEAWLHRYLTDAT